MCYFINFLWYYFKNLWFLKKHGYNFFKYHIFIFQNTVFLIYDFFFCKISHVSAMVFHNYVIFYIYKKSPVLFSILERKNKKKNLRPFHFSWLEIMWTVHDSLNSWFISFRHTSQSPPAPLPPPLYILYFLFMIFA